MKILVMGLVILMGCSGAKIKKAYDEGYASGRELKHQEMADIRANEAKLYEGRLDGCNQDRANLQKRLGDCYEADKNK